MENKRVVNVGGIDVWEGMELETLANNSKFSVGSGMKIVSIYDGGCVCRYGILDEDTIYYPFNISMNGYIWQWLKPKVVDSAAQKGGEKIEFSVNDAVVHKDGFYGAVTRVENDYFVVKWDDRGNTFYNLHSNHPDYWGNFITKTTTASSAARVEEKKGAFRLEAYSLKNGMVNGVSERYDTAQELHDEARKYMLNGYDILFSGKVEVEYEYELKQEVRIKG